MGWYAAFSNLSNVIYLLIIFFVGVPIGKKFGDVITNVNSSYKPGDTVRCSWWGANPRHDLFTEKSYLYVDQLINQTWIPILTDGDLETRFRWEREGIDHSVITVEWDIPTTQPVGQTLYRLRHLGVKDNISGKEQYGAQSKNFTINN
jgi:neutral ceramidase